MTTSSTAIRNSIVAALGGFLFGFDTAVISGVEKSIQTLWGLSPFAHGFTVASASGVAMHSLLIIAGTDPPSGYFDGIPVTLIP